MAQASASDVRISELGLSSRAVSGLRAALPETPNPSVREVIETLTAAKLRETDGVGPQTVAEVEQALWDACGVTFIDSPRAE